MRFSVCGSMDVVRGIVKKMPSFMEWVSPIDLSKNFTEKEMRQEGTGQG